MKKLLRKVKHKMWYVRHWIKEHTIKQTKAVMEMKHIHGPKTIDLKDDDAITVTLILDVEMFLHTFIKHYSDLGVKYMVFVDTGSTDESINILKQYDNVIVWKSLVDFRKNEHVLRRIMAFRYAKNHWCFNVDIDELFDYPYSDKISFKQLLRYFKENQYTCMIANMLDMFADKPLRDLKDNPNNDLREEYPYYDLENILKEEYPWIPNETCRNTLSNKEIKFFRGGIRSTVFDLKTVYLIKHTLIFVDRKLDRLFNMHFSNGVSIADITGVIYHYKYIQEFYDRSKQMIELDSMAGVAKEYRQYVKVLRANPTLNLKQSTSKKINHANDLIPLDFLTVTQKYEAFVNKICDESL